MSEWAPRRFWKAVSTVEREDGWEVSLDGRPLRTPFKAPLLVPTAAMAEELAREWDAVGERVDPREMPWTRSANSAVDKVPAQRDEVVGVLSEYGATDLLSYRADHPEGLAERQAAAWDPLLDWAEARFGARLAVTAGMMPIPQDDEALHRLRSAIDERDDFALTGLHDLIVLTGSLVLGLAAAEDFGAPEEVWRWSRIDEEFQAEQWGRDAEADAAAASHEAAFLHAYRFHRAARSA